MHEESLWRPLMLVYSLFFSSFTNQWKFVVLAKGSLNLVIAGTIFCSQITINVLKGLFQGSEVSLILERSVTRRLDIIIVHGEVALWFVKELPIPLGWIAALGLHQSLVGFWIGQSSNLAAGVNSWLKFILLSINLLTNVLHLASLFKLNLI